MRTDAVPGGAQRRETLTRQRVLEAAVELADREGVDAVSMRRLGQELGIEAMSLYTHVRSKEDLLDGMVEVAFGEVPSPARDSGWKAALRRTILDARDVLLRHPWAPGVIETRRTTPCICSAAGCWGSRGSCSTTRPTSAPMRPRRSRRGSAPPCRGWRRWRSPARTMAAWAGATRTWSSPSRSMSCSTASSA
jgi:AcrR family transcriptional regulator